ncbi:hypothetical protein R3P38DRAFT_3278905 [Favolaschia claudopus]|uniref:Integrase catalytic domain-containing protein n=1 Tax=Favolaschia claudopus TaxID=2862362 RepID=A0AAW0AII0_9AGAR
MALSGAASQELLNAFRQHYHRYESRVHEAIANSADAMVLWRLGDDLEQYLGLVDEYRGIFPEEELALILQNGATMQNDIRLQYQDAVDRSHHGHPVVVRTVHTGSRGRPSIEIDPDFLRWAYSLRSTSSIARFLGVSRRTVRYALLEHGIAAPRQQPAPLAAAHRVNDTEENDEEQEVDAPNLMSYTGPLSTISEDDLDALLISLRRHYRRAGVTMLDGMLRRLGHHVPRERIRQSLIRIDPVHRVFERITIRRRTYHVPGPNSLWHHDGQHGLIRWRIVIHGFIDGYSRLITGLRASDNNRAQTVLDLFLAAAAIYLAPSRMRGDHGVENLLVAAYMVALHGEGRGSYLWGRSVHNVRIERLWVDVTAQIGATWADVFTLLELHHGLDINNSFHIWLLHYLFLDQINRQLEFFQESWNHHQIRMRDGPNRSPIDMFGFDMLVHGVRGTNVAEEPMTNEELEVYGVDWEGLHDESLLESRQENNTVDEGTTSWIGRIGPPPADQLNEVLVDPPIGPLSPLEMEEMDAQLGPRFGAVEDAEVANLWTEALVLARQMHPELF